MPGTNMVSGITIHKGHTMRRLLQDLTAAIIIVAAPTLGWMIGYLLP